MSDLEEHLKNLYEGIHNLVQVADHHQAALKSINSNTVELDRAINVIIKHEQNVMKLVKGHEARIALLEHALNLNKHESTN